MPKCPIFKAASLLGKKWSIVLLDEIEKNGEQGFNLIFKNLKHISPKILSKRLKDLEDSNLIQKSGRDNPPSQKSVYTNVTPMKTSYYLTEKGLELSQIIKLFKEWQLKYNELPCGKIKCSECPFYYTK